MDELDAARLRFPVGDEIVGTVSRVPWGPGRTGIFIDLGDGAEGFVDVLSLPVRRGVVARRSGPC
ncbi:MAG: hypothetical protein R2734_00070 [Nocardioides sp.]